MRTRYTLAELSQPIEATCGRCGKAGRIVPLPTMPRGSFEHLDRAAALRCAQLALGLLDLPAAGQLTLEEAAQ